MVVEKHKPKLKATITAGAERQAWIKWANQY